MQNRNVTIQYPKSIMEKRCQWIAPVKATVNSARIAFLANVGQADEMVKFYANTFAGSVFVAKEGEIVY